MEIKKVNEYYNVSKNKIIEDLCLQYEIKKFSINNGMVDVDGNVSLTDQDVEKIPIEFNRINGNFEFWTECNMEDKRFKLKKLKTLENAPKRVNKDFNCSGNELTTLIGGPYYVRTNYFCHYNNLKDVYGFPPFYVGRLSINHNPVATIINLAPENKQVKFVQWLNDNNVIRNGDTIIEPRLLDSLYEIGIKELERTEFYYYKLV